MLRIARSILLPVFAGVGVPRTATQLARWFVALRHDVRCGYSLAVRGRDCELGLLVSERLFSYGTLQQDNVQIATFGRLLATSYDELVGFKQELIEITDADVLAKSGKRFHPIVVRSGDPSDRVEGMVLEITPSELAAADRYEVSNYERVEAQLASGKTAWVYVKRNS